MEEGKLETVWSSEQVGRPLVKAWNALLSFTLTEAGSENGSASRLAIPIAGDDAAAKSVVSRLVDETGFDVVDAGPISESRRFQPGAPAYCTELDAAGVARRFRLLIRPVRPATLNSSPRRSSMAAWRSNVKRWSPSIARYQAEHQLRGFGPTISSAQGLATEFSARPYAWFDRSRKSGEQRQKVL